MSDTMRERFVRVTTELLASDPDLAMVLSVIGLGLFREAGALDHSGERIIDVGIREQMMIGTAAGLAIEGFRVIAHSYAPFLIERPFEQVKLDFAHQDVGAILVSVGATHDWAQGGRTHMCPADVSLVGTLPGWNAWAPGHPDEVEDILRRLIRDRSRAYIRLSESSNSAPRGDGVDSVVAVRNGSSRAPLVVAIGPMLDRTLQALEGVDVNIAYTARPLPLDPVGIQALLSGTDVAIVEPYLEGTSAAGVSTALRDRPHRLLCIGTGRDELRKYGAASDHDAAWGLDPAGIRARVTSFLERPTSLLV